MNLDRYVDTSRGKGLLGARMEVIGLPVLLIALALWAARDYIPTLAMTRVAATAVVQVSRAGSEADLDRAFRVAREKTHAEATLEPGNNTSAHGTSYLSVTAGNPELAKAGLSAVASALQAAFPSSERNLQVSTNDNTKPVPNALSERIALGVRVIVILLMVTGQLLMVVGAHFQGTGRRGLLMTIVMPFVLMLVSTSSSGISRRGTAIFDSTDFGFLLVLLAVTPISVVASLWLSRDPGRRRSRAKRH